MRLTSKKKMILVVLLILIVGLVFFIINVQMNQPANLPDNYMERLKDPSLTGDYIGLWKTSWHEENKEWLYPAKQYAMVAVAGFVCLSAWVSLSKAKFWK